MDHTLRLTAACRAQALKAGLWQSANGAMIPIERMPAPHLINALLKALAAAEPRSIIDPLTRELVRRGLEDAAMTAASRRMR
jgi:hypothetical protein